MASKCPPVQRDDARRRVLDALRSDPLRVFTAPAVSEMTGLSVLETILTLGGLTMDGSVERVRAGRYRHTEHRLPPPTPVVIGEIYRMPRMR